MLSHWPPSSRAPCLGLVLNIFGRFHQMIKNQRVTVNGNMIQALSTWFPECFCLKPYWDLQDMPKFLFWCIFFFIDYCNFMAVETQILVAVKHCSEEMRLVGDTLMKTIMSTPFPTRCEVETTVPGGQGSPVWGMCLCSKGTFPGPSSEEAQLASWGWSSSFYLPASLCCCSHSINKVRQRQNNFLHGSCPNVSSETQTSQRKTRS